MLDLTMYKEFQHILRLEKNPVFTEEIKVRGDLIRIELITYSYLPNSVNVSLTLNTLPRPIWMLRRYHPLNQLSWRSSNKRLVPPPSTNMMIVLTLLPLQLVKKWPKFFGAGGTGPRRKRLVMHMVARHHALTRLNLSKKSEVSAHVPLVVSDQYIDMGPGKSL